MSEKLNGIIVKGIAGFYYVEVGDKVIECKARGVFRHQELVPTVGDRCSITISDDGCAVIDTIEQRRNIFVRPAVANLDKLFVVVAAVQPSPNMLVIDRVVAAAEYADVEPIIVLTKTDLAPCDEVQRIYETAGMKVIRVNYQTGEGVEEVRSELTDCFSAFAGNSGVGKSTLLNAIEPNLSLKTAHISRKLGRGRHTTREVELFRLSFGGMIADTPGFSSFDGEVGAVIEKDQLQYCFREFSEHLGKCQFVSCAHLCEKGCAVLEALKSGSVPKSRHESYLAMYEEAKNIKPWENKKK